MEVSHHRDVLTLPPWPQPTRQVLRVARDGARSQPGVRAKKLPSRLVSCLCGLLI